MDMAKPVKLCKSPIITLPVKLPKSNHFMAILAMSLRPVRSGVLVRGMRCMPQVHAWESHGSIRIRSVLSLVGKSMSGSFQFLCLQFFDKTFALEVVP